MHFPKHIIEFKNNLKLRNFTQTIIFKSKNCPNYSPYRIQFCGFFPTAIYNIIDTYIHKKFLYALYELSKIFSGGSRGRTQGHVPSCQGIP